VSSGWTQDTNLELSRGEKAESELTSPPSQVEGSSPREAGPLNTPAVLRLHSFAPFPP